MTKFERLFIFTTNYLEFYQHKAEKKKSFPTMILNNKIMLFLHYINKVYLSQISTY